MEDEMIRIEDLQDAEEEFLTVAHMMNLCHGKDLLCIDAILTCVNDYRLMANFWKGNKIKLMEIEPTLHEAIELSKWNGDQIELALLHHEDYDLAGFIHAMKDFKGKLIVSYSGPKIFRDGMKEALQVRKVYFKKCGIPEELVDDDSLLKDCIIIKPFQTSILDPPCSIC